MIKCFCFRIFVLKQHLAELCLKLHYKIEKQKATKLCTHSLEGFHCHHKQTNTFLNILDRFPGLTGLHLPWGVEPLQVELIITIPSPTITHDQIVASLLSSPNTDFLLFCLNVSLFLFLLLSFFIWSAWATRVIVAVRSNSLCDFNQVGVCKLQCLLQCWPCKLVWPISRLQSRTLYHHSSISSGSSGSCRLL
jgi:hypothetical protein